MWDQMINLARWFRREFYEFSSMKLFGFEIDNGLHFVVGAAIFAIVAKRWGNRVACWVLAFAIVLKEVIDLFAKSSVDYLQVPDAAGWWDIAGDVLFSALGGLTVWLLQKWQKSRGIQK